MRVWQSRHHDLAPLRLASGNRRRLKKHYVIDVRRHFHRVDRKLDIHIALVLATAKLNWEDDGESFRYCLWAIHPPSGLNSSRQIVLMRMKESSNLLLQLDLGVRLAHGYGGPKEFPLGACG